MNQEIPAGNDKNKLGITTPNNILFGLKTSGLIKDLLGDTGASGDISYEKIVSQRKNFVKELGIEEYSLLLKKILWRSKTKVSFDDFCEFPDLRNNFRSYFSQQGYFLYEYAYRSRGFYKKFAENHENLLQELMAIYTRPDIAFYQETHEELRLLYRAYELMIEDEEVTMNHQLFG